MTLMIASSCSLLPTKMLEVSAKPIERQIAQPVLPRELDLKEPYWYVVSEKNIDEFMARVEKDQGQLVFFAMSVPDYELMAYNMQEIKRYIKDLKEVVVYYSRVTTPDTEVINAGIVAKTMNKIKVWFNMMLDYRVMMKGSKFFEKKSCSSRSF